MPKLHPAVKILNRSASWRGTIIHDVAVLERYMDMFLAQYFCKNGDRAQEFIDIILGNRVSLDTKRKIIEILIKKEAANMNFKMEWFTTRMNLIMKERNSFAHNATDFSLEAEEKCDTHLGLYKYGPNPKVDWYSKDRMKSIQQSIREITAFFMLSVDGE